MNFILKVWLILGSLAAAGFNTGAGDATNAAVPAIDPAFQPGLALLRPAAGVSESRPDPAAAGWRPDLQLLVGVKAKEGPRKQTIYFVELTALRPPATNAAGKPWSPVAQTNIFDWSATNGAAAPRHHEQFVWLLYPVRIRVFDESGRRLKEGQTTMPWGVLTNGLLDMCRLSFEIMSNTNGVAARTPDSTAAASREFDFEQNAELARSFGGGFIWMIIMFRQLQTVPELNEVWSKAPCAFRLPGLWTMAASLFKGLVIDLQPHLTEVSPAAGGADGRERWYHLPVELMSKNRKLTSVEIIVGPGSGAELLLAGIRSIRAVHPTKPQQEFLAQVLAAGVAGETQKTEAGRTGSH